MKTILIMLIMLIAIKVSAPPPSGQILIGGYSINPYEAGLVATSMVESGGDMFAINTSEKARGFLQIREIRLKDFNNRTGKHYTEEDLYTYDISREIYMYYASQIYYQNQERISREWNGWINGMEKESTVEYWEKIKLHLLPTPHMGNFKK